MRRNCQGAFFIVTLARECPGRGPLEPLHPLTTPPAGQRPRVPSPVRAMRAIGPPAPQLAGRILRRLAICRRLSDYGLECGTAGSPEYWRASPAGHVEQEKTH